MSSKTNGKEDEDFLFLEQVLDQFYDFGGGPASKKRLKSQKKKKRKQAEEEEEFTPIKDVCSDTDSSRAACAGSQHHQQCPQTEQTGSSSLQGNQVEVVTFQDPRKKLKTKQTPTPADKTPAPQITEKKQNDRPEELSLEKARLEVHRFGITGYKKEQQRIFEQDRAIMLGARPQKKDYINYKVLQQQIKEKKQKEKEEVEPELKKKKKQNNQRDKKRVSSGPSSAPSGQVGRFKNGMLILSSKEIQKIKGNKGGR
ncbi:40S small subunit processome assembly factor 1 [Echeneis naucrates]|uniref:Uncharacterized protein n=1 Tax=Echeneis naucrates TaxID=173247 RepID=A0A665UT89_ECHNA|nr:uncharacterized protein C1orf131 homolog [Echeneis naucrates]